MRFIDIAEWLVFRELCLHLTATTESSLQAPCPSALSTKLRSTLLILDFELRFLPAVVDAQQDLETDIIEHFQNEVLPVLTTFEKFLGVNVSHLLKEAGKAIEQTCYQDWKSDPESLPKISLVDESQCEDVVSALKSINECMQICFRARGRTSSSVVEPTKTVDAKFDSQHSQAIYELLNAIEKKLDPCSSRYQHQIFLQLAGQQWQECRSSPKSLFISSCEAQTALQGIEVFDAALITNSVTEARKADQELVNLCREIKRGLDFNSILKLRRLDHLLYKMVSREYIQQKVEAPIVSIRHLIEENIFLPVSFDCVNEHSVTISEKRKLALELSRCLLQLLDCKWTNHCWNIDEIFFLSSPFEVPTSYLRDVPPYIACKAVESCSGSEGCGDPLGDSVFLQFSKLLVEIETGHQVLPTVKNKHGNPSLFFTLTNIIKDGRLSSTGEEYLQAIEACLQLHLDTLSEDTKLNTKERQQDMYDMVVAKLEKDVGHYRSFSLKRKRRGSGEHERPSFRASPVPSTIETRSTQKLMIETSVSLGKEASFCLPSHLTNVSKTHSGKPCNLEVNLAPSCAPISSELDIDSENASQPGLNASYNSSEAVARASKPPSSKSYDALRSYEHYTVAIVCAMEFEMSAVRYMLDQEHPRLRTKKGDPNIYILGELSGHDVVLACLPGTQGKGPAATVATNLARTFPSIQWRFLVGIGGGVPSTKHDIRLGDVVISISEGQCGSVVQYDLGKETDDGFVRKGPLISSPPLLCNAASMMKSTHRLSENKIEEFLSAMLQKAPGLDIYRQPSGNLDTLFESGYSHKPMNATCEGCDKQKIVNRIRRKFRGPVIHYGLVASGDRVIKSSQKRDEIIRTIGNDILCFEMEAAGLATDFSCVVIRGISDYADSHKNDDWHYYAAATAAACTKELLTYVDPI